MEIKRFVFNLPQVSEDDLVDMRKLVFQMASWHRYPLQVKAAAAIWEDMINDNPKQIIETYFAHLALVT